MNKTATNTTLLNLSKQNRLAREHVYPRHIVTHEKTTAFLTNLLKLPQSKRAVLYNLGKHLLGATSNVHARRFLAEEHHPVISFTDVPTEEFDLLGAAYQYLNTKSENLAFGSFYTSRDLVLDMTKEFKFDEGQTLIDLACGSGVFLFAPDVPEDQLYGVDFDPVAVMIAKFNFFLKFPDAKNYPRIYHADFLAWYIANRDARFTYVVGNPPYGANLDTKLLKSGHITSGESFSYFIEYGFALLEARGTLSYLVPEALLNVKRHADIRDFLLDNAGLRSIKQYDTRFAGVMSDIYAMTLDRGPANELVFQATGRQITVRQDSFRELKNHIFTALEPEDIDIINRVKQRSTTSLRGSLFALGIVTGDNATKLLPQAGPLTEQIFTGKEVERYQLLPALKHLVFDRSQLQQVAPDAVYRADVKLVYKVISRRLKVALDFSRSLTTASANIVIPKVPGNNAYSVALLLNSDLYSFLNQRLHGTVNKISRENLEALPMPVFTVAELEEIEELVQAYLRGACAASALEAYVYTYFGIPTSEQAYVRANLA